MKLFERYSQAAGLGSLHSAVSTTFGIDFGALEQLLLPQFRGVGTSNILVMADPGMAAMALSPGAVLPRKAGSDYAVFSPRRRGVFHPKIVFQAGRGGARVVIGSANTTWSGLGGNREVVSEILCRAAPEPERAFVVAVWTYLRSLVADQPGPALEALNWLEARTPWLAQATDEPAERVWSLSDGTRLGFFADPSPGEPSIFARFVAEALGAPVEELVIASPYWDQDLASVKALIAALAPARTRLLIQPTQRLFPAEAARGLPVSLHDIGAPACPPGSGRRDAERARFSHAKVILVTGGGHDHVLSGSANCTWAALGDAIRGGINGEATVYRRLPAGSVVEALGLAEALESLALNLAEIEPPTFNEPIPLEASLAARPGDFEVEFSRIAWRPAAFSPARVAVELLDGDQTVVARLSPEDWTPFGSTFTAQLEAAAHAALFARAIPLAGDEVASGLAIVTRREVLKRGRRERNHKADRAAQNLRDDPGLDLRYLDLLDFLEREDEDQAAADATAPLKRTQRQRSDAAPEEGRTLTYDQFIATRPTGPQVRKGDERNSLAGSSPDILRALLNELAHGAPLAPEHDAGANDADLIEEELIGDDGAPAAAVTSEDAETAGATPPRENRSASSPLHTSPEPSDLIVDQAGWSNEESKPRPTLDPRTFTKAVDGFRARMRARFDADAVGSIEVLRLRTMLLVLLRTADLRATPGFEPTLPQESSAKKRKATITHLALSEESDGWPRLVVAVLASFFNGEQAPIIRLAVDPRYDSVPADFVEAWAVVMLALAALHAALEVLPALATLAPHLAKLEITIQSRIGAKGDPACEQIRVEQEALAKALRTMP